METTSKTAYVSSALRRGRLRGIDATRGAAMFFVCLAHFSIYFKLTGANRAEWIFITIGRIASPTFMLISGVVLGFLYAFQRQEFPRLRDRLIDRGLFLLTVTHVLISGSHFAVYGGIPLALLSGVITDSIGLNLIVGALLIARMSMKQRLLVSAVLYSFGWCLVFLWQPQATWLEVIKQLSIGSTRSLGTGWEFDCPLVPWFSYYFAASCLGEKLGALYLEGNRAQMKTLVLWLGVGAVSLAVSIAVIFVTIHGFWVWEYRGTILYVLSSPMWKSPPAPAYFGFYGGIGLLILWFFLKIEHLQARGIEIVTMVGQTSLFVFVFEYYVYLGAFPVLHAVMRSAYTAWWPIYFMTSVVAITLACWLWQRQGYNRFITVGYPARFRLPASAVPSSIGVASYDGREKWSDD